MDNNSLVQYLPRCEPVGKEGQKSIAIAVGEQYGHVSRMEGVGLAGGIIVAHGRLEWIFRTSHITGASFVDMKSERTYGRRFFSP